MDEQKQYRIELVTEFSESLATRLRYLVTLLDDNYQPLTDDDVKAIVSSDTTHLLIARDIESQEIVGMITVVAYRIPYKLKGWMEDLAVDEAYRGKGIATLLIEESISLARKLGVIALDFTSQPMRESANQLYSRLGFVKRETNVYRLKL